MIATLIEMWAKLVYNDFGFEIQINSYRMKVWICLNLASSLVFHEIHLFLKKYIQYKKL